MIKNNLTKKNKIYRYGGDEFAVVSQGMTEEDLNNIFENVNIELKNKENEFLIYSFLKSFSVIIGIPRDFAFLFFDDELSLSLLIR